MCTCFHLPDVGRAIAAADDQEVVQRPPLDRRHREEMARGQHHAAPLSQRQQRHGVVARHAAHAQLDARAAVRRGDVQADDLTRLLHRQGLD